MDGMWERERGSSMQSGADPRALRLCRMDVGRDTAACDTGSDVAACTVDTTRRSHTMDVVSYERGGGGRMRNDRDRTGAQTSRRACRNKVLAQGGAANPRMAAGAARGAQTDGLPVGAA